MFRQSIGNNMDRFQLIEEGNKKVFDETQKILDKYNAQDNDSLNDKNKFSDNNNNENSKLNESDIDRMYKEFSSKTNYNSKNNNNNYINKNKNEKSLLKMKSNTKFTFTSPPDGLLKKPKKIISSTVGFNKIKKKN
jgi:CCR4-NOT transcription complex subunit 7/8